MSLHRTPLAEAEAVPWRNGGGQTRELLIWPPHDTPWLLRISIAAIDASGPFSAFPGLQRWFAVIEGDGVRLALPGGEVTLAPGDDPLAFDGEAAPACDLLGGSTQDLNFMVRRDAGSARMWRARAGDGIAGSTRWRGLYAARNVLLEIEGRSEPVAAGTLAWTDAHNAEPWQLHHASPGAGWFMTLTD